MSPLESDDSPAGVEISGGVGKGRGAIGRVFELPAMVRTEEKECWRCKVRSGNASSSACELQNVDVDICE